MLKVRLRKARERPGKGQGKDWVIKSLIHDLNLGLNASNLVFKRLKWPG